MTDFKAWIAPEGAVVAPPVHPKAIVEVIWSDGCTSGDCHAADFNWSNFGDGTHVVAYAVVREYREPVKPREWWAVGQHLHVTYDKAAHFRGRCADEYGAHHLETPIIHVREVLE